MNARVRSSGDHVADVVETREQSSAKMAVADTFGRRMARVIEAGVDVRHGPRVPALNAVLAVTNRISPLPFLLLTLAVFLGVAVCLAAALYAGDCWCDARGCRRARFGRLLLLTFRQVAAGADADYLGGRGAARAPARCAAAAAAGDFLALVLQSVFLGVGAGVRPTRWTREPKDEPPTPRRRSQVVAAKFTAPRHNRLVFSSRLVEFARDGRRTLSFRVAHPQGHLVAAFAVTMLWVRPHKTEPRMVFEALDVDTHRAELDVPLEITHTVADGSPLLAADAYDLQKAPGFVRSPAFFFPSLVPPRGTRRP